MSTFMPGKYRIIAPMVKNQAILSHSQLADGSPVYNIAGPQPTGKLDSLKFRAGDVVEVTKYGYNYLDGGGMSNSALTVTVKALTDANKTIIMSDVKFMNLEKVDDSTAMSKVLYSEIPDPNWKEPKAQNFDWMSNTDTYTQTPNIQNEQKSQTMLDKINKYWTNVLTVIGIGTVIYLGYLFIIKPNLNK